MEDQLLPSTPGKIKSDRRTFHRCFASTSTMFLWALFLIALTASYLSFLASGNKYLSRGAHWEKKVISSAEIRRKNGLLVLVTGAGGFVGSHVALALKKRGDGVVGIDNFNDYYDRNLKWSRRNMLESKGVFIVEADINDRRMLAKLFEIVEFTHVMHLAAQAGVRYAMENPNSYVHSNIAGLVTLLEQCKQANPQPAVVWASSSSVYGLNEKVPFSESDRTDKPASLYAATKKAGEEITHTYNHIYGLSITGLRFFTVYGPWGRPDMAYFSFTKNILQGKPITVYRGKGGVDLARDFTYIDDVVKGCVASLDTAGKSTGSGGKKRGSAPYRIFNLGNTSPVTVPALVGILEKNLKMKAKKNVVDMPGNGDVPFTHANISLARRELGYKPTTDLATGLKKFVKWYLWYYGHQGKTKPVHS
ncbi:UDP-glucuronate 4-epimerase 1-like [Bidens hawaiensis]|uniref:UDP-glucuronate 4-epimerase 1-like n=1 Tax=Bidens hawaiensis TaxID=980011 RepID=UPI00404B4CD6